MTTEDRIRDKKLQYDLDRDAAKLSALLLGKVEKYEYIEGKEVLPSNQSRMI